ncbi:thiol:disulfide interchange protein DsbA/DsbL [Solimicrobium silvestre]|uniref:Thiol:disulfide interchange protein n=1 Tax=Solimicrobium silvestre TaxID=2099400 RepID=A0A2S9GSD6_9BURK|nr:thiol:disulfide interchange protein DsbA/DsbL [Solimicrobium silvestre]PRC90627.1 DSBA-like thioredoxin domain [Solimicrobium silvestre]
MHLIKKTVAAILFGCISVSVLASPTNPESGKEYIVLTQPQQTDAVGKVEVTEFFYYSCPHCNTLDPYITEWVKKQGNAISFKRVHVDFGQGQQPLQRMYYTLEALGKLDELHARIFQAIHKERQFLRTDQDMLNFVVKNGVDKMKYLETSKSFTIESKIRRAAAMQASYKIEFVPAVFVDGRYMTAPSQLQQAMPGTTEVEGSQNMLPVLDALVLKVQKERGFKK